MLQKHPITKPVILKIGGASLSSAENIRQVMKLVKQLKPSFIVVSALRGHTQKLQQIADKFFEDENPSDAWGLFESFKKNCFEIANELKIVSKIQNFFDSMKKEIQEQTDVDVFSIEQHKRKDFTDFLLSFGERISALILSVYFQKKGVDTLIRADARNFIAIDDSKKKIDGGFEPNVSNSVDNLVWLLKRRTDVSIVMEGFIAGKNKNLGLNGSDTTLALVALAYQQIGLNPEVLYLKAQPFKMEGLISENISFSDFVTNQRGGDQFFVHEDAVCLLQTNQIPFFVLCSQDPEYRLCVGVEVQETFEVSKDLLEMAS